MLHTVTRNTGEPPLVLIHGWACDHAAMLPVANAFAGHRSLAPDLLGHGRSPESSSYAIETQADAVLAVAPGQAVWIGHSMGAQVALAAAARAPERVSAAVLLDPAQIAPHERAASFGEGLRRRLEMAEPSTLMEAFVRGQLVQPTDPAGVEAVIATMVAADGAVTRAAWDAILAFDGRAALASATCPILLITIDKPLNRPADVARLNPRVLTGQVAGSGHMLQFEVMDQVAAMIRRFLVLEGLVSGG